MKGRLSVLLVGAIILFTGFSCAAGPPAFEKERIERKLTVSQIEIHDAYTICIEEPMAIEIHLNSPVIVAPEVYGTLITWHDAVSYFTKKPHPTKCDQHDYGSCTTSRSAVLLNRPSLQFYLSWHESIPWPDSNTPDTVKPNKKSLRRS